MMAWLAAFVWLAFGGAPANTASFEPVTWTVAGEAVHLLRSFEGLGLTLSASCRTRTGALACQALQTLASASRRSPEAKRHGVGSFDCPDFHAARVEPAEGVVLCRFADGSLIGLHDLDTYAREKDAWEEALRDPIAKQLPRFQGCLMRVQHAAVGALVLEAAFTAQGRIAEATAARPNARDSEWPRARQCVIAALRELTMAQPPSFLTPRTEVHLMLGGEARVDSIAVTWQPVSVRVRVGKPAQ